MVAEQWTWEQSRRLKGATYPVQGFGNVASWAAWLLKPRRAELVAVEDLSGPFSNPEGSDPDELCTYTKAHPGRVAGYPQVRPIHHEALMSTAAEIYALAATENQTTTQTASLLKVRLVPDGASGSTDPGGDAILAERALACEPMSSALSAALRSATMALDKPSESWDLEEVDASQYREMVSAHVRVCDAAQSYDANWRSAAYILVLSCLRKVQEERHLSASVLSRRCWVAVHLGRRATC